MADIELVIKIPKELYESYKGRPPMLGDVGIDMIAQSIANGEPLPKGHGNLIYREDVESLFKNARKTLYEQSKKEQIMDFWTRENMLLNSEQIVHLIDPVIPADKEGDLP